MRFGRAIGLRLGRTPRPEEGPIARHPAGHRRETRARSSRSTLREYNAQAIGSYYRLTTNSKRRPAVGSQALQGASTPGRRSSILLYERRGRASSQPCPAAITFPVPPQFGQVTSSWILPLPPHSGHVFWLSPPAPEGDSPAGVCSSRRSSAFSCRPSLIFPPCVLVSAYNV